MESIRLVPRNYETYITQSFHFFCSDCKLKNKSGYACTHYSKIQSIDTNLFLQGKLRVLADELLSSMKSQEERKEKFGTIWNFVQEKKGDASEEEKNEIFSSVLKLKVSESFFKSAENWPASSLWIGGHRYTGILFASKLAWAYSDLKLGHHFG